MRPLALLLALAGCTTALPPAVPQEARPDRVILYRDTVTVLMSDRTLCALERPGRARTWSGTLKGCPHALPVSVTLPPGFPPRAELRQGGALVTVNGESWG